MALDILHTLNFIFLIFVEQICKQLFTYPNVFQKITLKNLPLINTLLRHQETEPNLTIKKKLRLIWNSKWFHTFAPEYKRKNLN